MKKRKHSKPRVWRVWVCLLAGRPASLWPASSIGMARYMGIDIRLCEIREAPKPKRRAKR